MHQVLFLTANMSCYQKVFLLALIGFPALVSFLPFVASQCSRNPVIFNFGDSNSDTGSFAAATGSNFGYPDGRAFFHQPMGGRLCDGRLIVDFLCENVRATYLTPYLESVEPDFRNGANFAISGAATLSRYFPFSLGIQLLQFKRFRNRSLEFQSKGFKNVIGEEDFRNALYTIDIGQNDLAVAFDSLSYDQVIEKIPSFISEIRDAMWAINQLGGKNFWVHNTGPLGCLPAKLGTTKANATDLDRYGCIRSLNEGAKAFNAKLNDLCRELQFQMKNSTIVYVDIYSIKYNLIVNSASYGFENPLAACCGYGGAPYNFDPNVQCRGKGYNVCGQGSKYVSWDGVHYAEAANAVVAYNILSTRYSTPPLEFNFFCNSA